MSDLVLERLGASYRLFDCPEWTKFKSRTYECRVLLCPEPEGGYSVHAIRLPGVVSQGETEEEALANIADAFQEVIRTYVEDGGTIPWSDADTERPKGSLERWILVHV